MRRRQLLARTGALGTGLLGMSTFANTTRGQETNESSVDAYTDAFTTENLGSHNLSFPMGSGSIIDNTIYFGTRIANPSGIGRFDLETNDGEFYPATGKDAIWGSASVNDGEDLYFTTHGQINCLDISEGTTNTVLNMDMGIDKTWDLDSAPGDNKIFAGSGGPPQVWEYDPDTGEGHPMYGDPKLTNGARVRSVSADAETVYVGVGGNGAAQLIAIDREDESKEFILARANNNSPLANENYVYELSNNGQSEEYVAFGTHGTPLIGYVNKNDYTDYQVAEAPEIHPVIDSSYIQDSTIYFTAKFPATLYKYDIPTNEITQLAEAPGISTRDLFFKNNQIIGLTEANYIWKYDIASGTMTSQNVLSADFEGVPQSAQSVSGYQGKGYVGASGQTSIHDAKTGDVNRISTPGEPKVQEWVDGTLYLCCYSNGDLVRYDPENSDHQTIPRVARSESGRVRPRSMHYDANTERLFIGTTKSEVGGGDLFAYDPESEQVINTYQDFFNDQVSSITSLPNDDSNNIFVADNSLFEVDPTTGEKLQELPTPNGEIPGLTALDRPRFGAPETMNYIYGITGTTLFAVEPASSSLVFEKDLPGGTEGRLRTHQGLIFGAGNDKMFVCDPGTEKVSSWIAT